MSRVFPTKTAAQTAGRSQAQREHTEHIVHDANGQIASRNSYGNDPRRARG